MELRHVALLITNVRDTKRLEIKQNYKIQIIIKRLLAVKTKIKIMKDTIIYKGFKFEYNLNHQPEEPQTRDYPGCAEEFEIYDITLNGIDASELLEAQIEEFENFVIKKLKQTKP